MMINLSCAFPTSLRAFQGFLFSDSKHLYTHHQRVWFLSFRFGCAPIYPHYMQPTLKGVCLQLHWKRGSAVKRSTNLSSLSTISVTASDYWLWWLINVSSQYYPVSRYIPSNTWKWLLRPQRGMASNNWAKTLRLSIICARKIIDKNKHIFFLITLEYQCIAMWTSRSSQESLPVNQSAINSFEKVPCLLWYWALHAESYENIISQTVFIYSILLLLIVKLRFAFILHFYFVMVKLSTPSQAAWRSPDLLPWSPGLSVTCLPHTPLHISYHADWLIPGFMPCWRSSSL